MRSSGAEKIHNVHEPTNKKYSPQTWTQSLAAAFTILPTSFWNITVCVPRVACPKWPTDSNSSTGWSLPRKGQGQRKAPSPALWWKQCGLWGLHQKCRPGPRMLPAAEDGLNTWSVSPWNHYPKLPRHPEHWQWWSGANFNKPGSSTSSTIISSRWRTAGNRPRVGRRTPAMQWEGSSPALLRTLTFWGRRTLLT